MNPTANKDTVLNVSGISKRFGGLQALTDVGMTIQRGQVYGLIGPNGAGKTTVFNLLMRLYDVTSGAVRIDQLDVRDVVGGSLRGDGGRRVHYWPVTGKALQRAVTDTVAPRPAPVAPPPVDTGALELF